MKNVAGFRRSVSQSSALCALVGVTDIVVEKVREAGADAAQRVNAFDARKAQQHAVSYAQEVPALAVHRLLTRAGQAEQAYNGLAERGQTIVDRMFGRRGSHHLTGPGASTVGPTTVGPTTVGPTTAGPTTARQPAAERVTAARRVVRTGSSSAGEGARATPTTARRRAAGARTAAAGAGTARRSAATSRSAAKSAATSAARTAAAAHEAARAAEGETGQESTAG